MINSNLQFKSPGWLRRGVCCLSVALEYDLSRRGKRPLTLRREKPYHSCRSNKPMNVLKVPHSSSRFPKLRTAEGRSETPEGRSETPERRYFSISQHRRNESKCFFFSYEADCPSEAYRRVIFNRPYFQLIKHIAATPLEGWPSLPLCSYRSDQLPPPTP